MPDAPADSPQTDASLADLGPLAWVFDELRKSLDVANKAIKRFVRESEQSRNNDLGALDPASLRLASQQLHQAVGALELVGLVSPAQVLRAMEAAVQRFLQKPEICTSAASVVIERAGFALVEYLEAVLNNKPLSPLALFAQYREVQELAAAERVHPADLWTVDHHGLDLPAAPVVTPLRCDPVMRSLFDRLVLLVVKTDSPAAAQQLAKLCSGLSAGTGDVRPQTFWRVAAGFFEALASRVLPMDVFVKRTASRVLLQVATFAQGRTRVSETLLRDLLFFCAQAKAAAVDKTPRLWAVRDAFGFDSLPVADYHQATLGRYDPALLVQARKRIHAAKEAWALFSGGDSSRARQVQDQIGLVADALLKLHPLSTALARVLVKAADRATLAASGVRAELAMEVATTTLYLEAAFDDFDPNDEEMAQRTQALAERLEAVLAGLPGQPLDVWMEQLYRRVSDRQTMGSVVGELKASLGDAEKSLDQFFRFPGEKAGLHVAVSQLAQMRGVLSVLGLDHAVQTVASMLAQVDEILDTKIDAAQALEAGTFRQLGNNLSVLGFLIDMISYQPMLAKKLFVFDEEKGELLPLMGRHAPVLSGLPASFDETGPIGVGLQHLVEAVQQDADLENFSEQLDRLANEAALAEQAVAGTHTLLDLSRLAQPGEAVDSQLVSQLDEDDGQDVLNVFLEEAREVLSNSQLAVITLREHPGDLASLTTLRRAFHTLKGSARMVGLVEFADAAWAMEQTFNALLADQQPAQPGLLDLSQDAMQVLARWVADIATQNDARWTAEPLRASAQAWRNVGEYVPLEGLPKSAAAKPLSAHAASTDAAQPHSERDTGRFTLGDFDQDLPMPAGQEPREVGTETDPVAQPTVAENQPAAVEGWPEIEPDLDLADDPMVVASGAAAAEPLLLLPLPLPLPLPTIFDNIDFGALAAFSAREGIEARTPTAETAKVAGLALPELPLAADLIEDTTENPTGWLTDGAEKPDQPLPTLLEAIVGPQLLDLPHAPMMVDDMADDQSKVIGMLRIGIKLYNVYLNEADEWSRRLSTELAEWSLERHKTAPAQAESLAHSLSGSSATVGFKALSEIARALEQAIATVRLHQAAGRAAAPDIAQLFVHASEDIRRLLHQFAAGFLKEPNPELLAALRRVVHAPMAQQMSDTPPESVDERADTPMSAAQTEAHPADAVLADLVLPEAGNLDLPALARPSSEPAQVPAREPVQDIDDDIDALDTIDVDLFPIFAEEVQELLPRLGGALRQWVARPDNASARGEVLRNLHTIKGSARLAGALRLGEMAHRMETSVERLGSTLLRGADLEPVQTAFDAIENRFETLRSTDLDAQARAQNVAQSAPETAAAGAEVMQIEAAHASEPVCGGAGATEPTGLKGLSLPVLPLLVPVRAGAAVRVRPELLDRMVNQAGEVMISRTRMEAELVTVRSSLKELTGNLDRLRGQLRDMELQAETQMQSRLAQARDADQAFDPLEFDRFTRVQEITRAMAESVNDLATVQRNLQRALEATEDGMVVQGRQARELQRDLLRTRMVEFEGISERLYRVVRQASKETGKQVRLDITGGSIEMDRGVLDRLTAAFEHLLRNSVVHGIESPEIRQAAGKPVEGRIEIRLVQELNDVSVVFSDDGAGLDLVRLRERAAELGTVADAAALGDAEAAQLVFEPGLSTATETSPLAGRGVGMDVVRSDVLALGGRIETHTESGSGARFRLILPLTTAVTQVVMVRAGVLTFGVPSNLVEVVRRLAPAELAAAYATDTLPVTGEAVPFFWAGALLQSSPRSQEGLGRTLPVVIFRSAQQRIAMHVDQVLGNREVVVKNLGPQLSRLPGLAGMSMLASGAVALIYNPVALATAYGAQVSDWIISQQAAQPQTEGKAGSAAALATSSVPLVLVVDDSITVRRVTQRLLQREGYRVALAADGLQALERLQQERPAVVLADIEMPRMDGFDLVRNIRSDARLSGLPVIMITSRIAEKHREHARELGVDHYLGKPYSEDQLLGLVAHYARAAADM